MSCLFDSLSQAINDLLPDLDQKVTSTHMRKYIVDYLEEMYKNTGSKDMIEVIAVTENFKNSKEYLEAMRKDNVWGGFTEIAAFTTLFKSKVILYFSNGVIYESDNSPNPISTIHLSYNGSHFTFLYAK